MKYPFCVYTKKHPVGLYQLDDGRFQMIKQGNLTPLMVDFGYVIVEKTLANFLKDLQINSVEFKDAVIWNRSLNIEYNNYSQLFIKNHFSIEQIQQLDLSGNNLFVMDNNSLFVTPKLKSILENAEFKYLKFSEGLSYFA